MLKFVSALCRPLSSSRKPRPSLHCRLISTTKSNLKMELRTIVNKLEDIAPTRFTESWDNVGLLLEPQQTSLINRILLTNDLTEPVMEEAVNQKVGLIISYHPPIFRPLKRLTQQSTKERIVLRAVQCGMAVYSPHTALDPAINDWLLSGLGDGEITSLAVGKLPTRLKNRIQLLGVSCERVRDLFEDELTSHDITSLSDDRRSGADFLCSDATLVQILPKLREKLPTTEVIVGDNHQYEVHLRGGKKLTLPKPHPLSLVVDKVKAHLKLPHIRLAMPFGKEEDPLIKTVSVCAGSGGSVLSGVDSDLYLTGEMGHHDVLDACSRGTAVLLCEHTNTERGYLQQIYKNQVEDALGGHVEVVLPDSDRDPLKIV